MMKNEQKAAILAIAFWFLSMWCGVKAHGSPAQSGIEVWFVVFTMFTAAASVLMSIVAITEWMDWRD